MTQAIDCWCNPFTPAWQQRLYHDVEEFRRVSESWGPKMLERTRGYSVPDFLGILDRVEISTVLIPSFQLMSYQSKEMYWDIEPEQLLPLLESAPDRFRGLFGVNPLRRMEGVRALERAVRELRFVGAHLHSYGFGTQLNDAELYPFYAKCAELDIPILIQTGHAAGSAPNRYGRPLDLDEVALYFPELKIVAAHCGWPWVEELIALASKHQNLFIATTGYMPRYWDKSLVHFLNSHGRGKVMWGTDFPVIGHAESLEDISRLELRPDAAKLLLHDVAARVFKL
jgi:uncharacterized protein